MAGPRAPAAEEAPATAAAPPPAAFVGALEESLHKLVNFSFRRIAETLHDKPGTVGLVRRRQPRLPPARPARDGRRRGLFHAPGRFFFALTALAV